MHIYIYIYTHIHIHIHVYTYVYKMLCTTALVMVIDLWSRQRTRLSKAMRTMKATVKVTQAGQSSHLKSV